MVILDKMIMTCRFTEFVNELLKIRNEELIDRARWDVWLHKIIDMDFDEYLSKLNDRATVEEIQQVEMVETTIKDSFGLINGFCPS